MAVPRRACRTGRALSLPLPLHSSPRGIPPTNLFPLPARSRHPSHRKTTRSEAGTQQKTLAELMAVPRSSSPSDSCRLGSLGRRIVLRGARGRRKLARLRVAKRPPRRRGLGTPHLQRERPGRAGPEPRLARHRWTKHS
ncbi:hypothetical protein CapIbe_003795 [Capra ibex]